MSGVDGLYGEVRAVNYSAGSYIKSRVAHMKGWIAERSIIKLSFAPSNLLWLINFVIYCGGNLKINS